MLGLAQGLRRNVQVGANEVATTFGQRRRTWREVHERVARLAAGLQAMGVQRGDRVGMLALNSDRYVEWYYAVWWAGGVVVPINFRWSPHEIAYGLDDSDTRILFVDDAFLPLVESLRQKSTALQHVIYTGDAATPEGMDGMEALMAAHAPVDDALREGDDLAGIFYTGGTTGLPKGVMLSHDNLIHNALIAMLAVPMDERDRMLQVAPLFHMSGLAIMLRAVLRGAQQILLPAFDPLAVLKTIVAEHATSITLVPTMLQMLVDHPQRADYDLSSIRVIGYGAAPISEAVLERAFVAFPNAGFGQAFGQTELSPCITVLTEYWHTAEGRRHGKLRSTGQPLPGCEVRIVDADDNEVPRGTVGEIVARSAGVMLGYWNRPEETAQALRGGWMHMGDAGYMDEDGFVFVVDRIKDMIVTGAENVYSAEVEHALMRHAAVQACAVIGIPSEKWGESVHAVVVRKPDAEVEPEVLIAHCRELIAGYKCPRSIEFRDQLPLSGAGKVLKYELREPFWRASGRNVA